MQRRATPLLGKYVDQFPVLLTRIEKIKGGVVLLDFESQAKKQSSLYDLKLQTDGLVHPVPHNSTEYFGPNGASLRPPTSITLMEVLGNMRGVRLILIPQGTKIPHDLILLHEHSDHYSLQTTVPISLKQFNARLNAFFAPFERMSTMDYQNKFVLQKE